MPVTIDGSTNIVTFDRWRNTGGVNYNNVINTYVAKNTGALYSTTSAWAPVPGMNITRNFTIGNLILCICEVGLRTQNGAQSHPGLTLYVNGANVGNGSYGLCIWQQAAGPAHANAVITHTFIASQASNTIEFQGTRSVAGQDSLTFAGEASGSNADYRQGRLIVMEIQQ
jgi:hypothetical protein